MKSLDYVKVFKVLAEMEQCVNRIQALNAKLNS
jgi:hypothetical protein